MDGLQVQWLLDRDSVDMADELSIYLHGIVDFDDEGQARPSGCRAARRCPTQAAEPAASAEPDAPAIET